MDKLTAAIAEMDKCIKCLALELHEAVHGDVVETWTALKAALSSAPVPAAPAVVHPNILKDVDSEWDTEKSDNIVTCHCRMIGGVLYRWWGDGPEPSGVKKIDAALSSAPVDAPVQAGAGVDALKGLPRYSCGDGHDPCGHGSGLFQTVCGDVFKVADVLAALSQNKEA